MFIVLEGIDGSGTTTQAERLGIWLSEIHRTVTLTREPTDNRIGRLIRESLRRMQGAPEDARARALLFAADRAEHLAGVIEPALARGEIVVCDRYVLSSLAYQSLECDPEYVAAINRPARQPDLTVLLDLPAEIAFRRACLRQTATGGAIERYDQLALQQKLREKYLELAREPAHVEEVKIVDAAADIDLVAEQIQDLVRPRLKASTK